MPSAAILHRVHTGNPTGLSWIIFFCHAQEPNRLSWPRYCVVLSAFWPFLLQLSAEVPPPAQVTPQGNAVVDPSLLGTILAPTNSGKLFASERS